jgi:hypothetical protein
MRTFFTVWFGQLVSLLGSQLTGFALGVWVAMGVPQLRRVELDLPDHEAGL